MSTEWEGRKTCSVLQAGSGRWLWVAAGGLQPWLPWEPSCFFHRVQLLCRWCHGSAQALQGSVCRLGWAQSTPVRFIRFPPGSRCDFWFHPSLRVNDCVLWGPGMDPSEKMLTCLSARVFHAVSHKPGCDVWGKGQRGEARLNYPPQG